MQSKVQSTSIQAYNRIDNLGERQRTVYTVIKLYQPICNLELSHKLGIPINQVTPRTNELVKMDLVKEAKRDIVKETGRRAIFWEVVQDEPVQESIW